MTNKQERKIFDYWRGQKQLVLNNRQQQNPSGLPCSEKNVMVEFNGKTTSTAQIRTDKHVENPFRVIS